MTSLSKLVLIWIFGTWVFGSGEIDANITSMSTQVTPLTIFASQFTTVGLAGFGLLGSWAIFLGIFRLRNNGNFFGSRDSNEAFFYPMRMMFALTLCAPVIPIASPGGVDIVLTPGHTLITSIAKQGSEWGDTAQMQSFKLMHTYNLYADPTYDVHVQQSAVQDMFRNWQALGISAAGYLYNKNPYDKLSGISASDFAQKLIEGAWRKEYPNPVRSGYYGPTSSTDEFITEILNHTKIPVIPPTDAVATSVGYVDSTGTLADGSLSNTTSYERQSENWLCQFFNNANLFCSSEQISLVRNNAIAISVAISQAQRAAWTRIVTDAMARVLAVKNDNTSSSVSTTYAQGEAYIQDLSTWYRDTVQTVVKNQLASSNLKQSENYFKAIEQWGWMMGGTFVLRAANDFSRAQSYASVGTGKLYPVSNLSQLTAGDDLTKLVQNKIEQNKDQGGITDLNGMLGFDILSKDPAKANLYTVSSFGREIASAGMVFLSGGAVAKIVSMVSSKGEDSAKIFTYIGVLLLIVGAMIGYVLPIVYAIYGLMGVFSWITFVMSSFFGVTLWGAAQAAPKGEEHTSQMAGKGWNVLVFIGFYPALAVGGLAAAVTLTSVGLPLVNVTMGGLWGMMLTGGYGQPFDALANYLIGAIVMVIVTCVLFWSVAMTSAQLITSFPRTVLNMISFSEPGLSPYENTPQGAMGQIAGLIKAPLSTGVSTVMRSIFTRNNSASSPKPGSAGI
ncbi:MULTISPECIES: hypothetical protein [Pseudomonas]|uniref:Conjugal transfer/type IV secretion protein DotA/TraY n=1 Tax=Pseudomonas lutea TaxID=243924 RepID=A0A9X8QLA4_9PSED|nr:MULTISPECIES: hypothetical protein [Pseudomonas]SER22228.1 conjugal transfer/type IV secretion protein DotA/TraY [Pseudomonas lutea]